MQETKTVGGFNPVNLFWLGSGDHLGGKNYWQRRATLMYYRYVSAIVRGVGADVKSLIDVGSSNTEILEEFDWIPTKVALDKKNVYSSATVRGISADFYDYSPETPFDLVTCFQVLEHIPGPERFARKLFEVGRHVLISVPYRWKAGDNNFHVNDPIDRDKLAAWTGRDPDYTIVVTEPFARKRGRRLIAYYHNPDEKFELKTARRNMKIRSRKAAGRQAAADR